MPLFGDAKQIPFKVFNPNADRYKGSNALLASGFRVRQKDADMMRRLIQPWQSRAYAYYDIVSEIKYAAQFYSRALSVLRLYPATKDDQGELEETQDPDAVEQLQRIQDPGGGTSGLLSSYGRLMFLAGECILFVSIDAETDLEQWEMLSTDELRITGSGFTRYKAPSMPAENYGVAPDEEFSALAPQPLATNVVGSTQPMAQAYRIWKRHPRYSYLADSTMQGVLDICEELVLLTQVIRARARSRMAGSGILLVNGKVTPVPLEPVPDEDPDEDPFVSEFTAAMTSPIVDEGSASAVVPLVVRVDTENLDNVMKHIQIIDPTQIYPETGLRRELIDRLAIGLDMPPEVLTGMGADSSHWTAWQIDEQTWKSHLMPVAQQLVDDLTSSFFQPMMRQLGKADWQTYYIAYDATAVINHPDRSKDANELFDRRAIGKSALRDAKGFTDDDAPTEEELWEQVGVALRDGSYVKYGIPTVRGTGGVEVAPGDLEGGTNDTNGPAPTNGVAPTEKVQGQGGPKGPPKSSTEQPLPEEVLGAGKNGHSSLSDPFIARIVGGADLALYRARELAGSRLRSLAKRHKDYLKLLDGVPSHRVAATLGRERVQELGAPNDLALVAGASDLMTDALRVWGIPDAMTAAITEKVMEHAARTLFQANPQGMPKSFRDYVAGMREAAG